MLEGAEIWPTADILVPPCVMPCQELSTTVRLSQQPVKRSRASSFFDTLKSWSGPLEMKCLHVPNLWASANTGQSSALLHVRQHQQTTLLGPATAQPYTREKRFDAITYN